MDMERITAKLDKFVEKKDYEGAKELLAYWLEDARSKGDLRASLSLYNESMGFFRKIGDKESAVNCAENALRILEKLEMEGTITAATTYINSATVYKAFGMADIALPYFEKAKEIYDKELKENDSRLGGLYNNMGLALLDLKRYEEAVDSYKKALDVMSKVKGGNLEKAITYLNIADVCDAIRKDREFAVKYPHTDEDWENNIEKCLDKAKECLDDELLPRNGYYAFVAEKCAPGFDYYGHFMYKAELEKRIREISENL
ncbi:MAG: tetratricopeptide repeat protein [Lachnospiraceae bacterium]|nr:tetratricopeptide repeat protein [Lachnospiraceae bacterium]